MSTAPALALALALAPLALAACGGDDDPPPRPTYGEVAARFGEAFCARLAACGGGDEAACRQGIASARAPASPAAPAPCTSDELAACLAAVRSQECGPLRAVTLPPACDACE